MDIQNTEATSEDEQFKEFKRQKRLEEAKSRVTKIEYDCLSTNIDKAILKETCQEADRLALGAIIVYPNLVKSCVAFLGDDPQVSLIAAISYPHGEDVLDIKCAAIKRAIKDGVDEVEVCAPANLLKDSSFALFKKECKKVKKACKQRAIRIVIDCANLEEKQIIKASTIAADVGINCIRLTSAGPDIISEVKTAVKDKCIIKSDGAENTMQFLNALTAGADTVGCTQALELSKFLLKEAEQD
ncbi:MAG: hypothetical protein K2N47_04245 [Clostridia bacterium]|nr:hypothetical protein [Clostridia bacterium]